MTLFESEIQVDNGATFSACRKYRYELHRIWDPSKPYVMFIGLNPSKADEIETDNTISVVRGYAERWGFGGVYMMNLFAIVSTDPKLLKTHPLPIGELDAWGGNLNDQHLARISKNAGDVVFAWGAFKEARVRGKLIAAQYPDAKCLVKNKDGTPHHPLYLPYDLKPLRFNQQAAMEAQSPASLKGYLTDKWICTDDKKYILHVGPTCSGKTYQAIEKLKQSTGCYLAPLRLLAWEIAEKLNESGFKCDLLTGEERRYVDGARLVASTIEMCDYDREYEVAVVDECFMVADKDRGKAWLKAILEINAREVHLILNEEAEKLLTEILTIAQKKFEIINYDRLTRLEVDPEPYRVSMPKHKTAFIVFSRAKALVQKSQFEKRGYNVSILYGNLPPETKKEQIRKFISGENTICISTDVIGMGLNLPCEYVCFLEMEKFDGDGVRPLNAIEIKQIGGRAGRYGFSDVGYVCGTMPSHIKAIRHGLGQKKSIERARFGLDYNMFRDIPKETALEKLQFFKKLNCIPEVLSHIVEKQDVNPMIELASYQGIRELDLPLQWTLVNSPIKDNNKEYFKQSISDIRLKKRINIPEFLNRFVFAEIADTIELGFYEGHISEIDLFCYFYNHADTAKLITPTHYESIISIKERIINAINVFLVDKKKSGIKRCEECKRELDITWPHKKCDSCFHAGRRGRWNDDYYYG